MSRTSLHTPRPPRAVWLRPATGTRLLPSLFPPTVPLHTPHYKRCPKALRLRLRSDQSPPRPLHGRSPDKSRHALTLGHCQVRAPLTRRIRFASSGDALEHSVMSPPWAIAPPPDSPGLDLAGESEQSDNLRLKTNAPFRDSTVVTIGELRSTNAGHGSTLPSLRMVEHFWWSRLPHTEIISRLFHVLSEARGCRKAGVDVEHPLWRTHPSVQASPSSCATIRDLPSPPPPSPLSTAPLGTTGLSPRVWVPRVGRPHPSPPTKGTAISHAHPFSIAGSPIPGRWRKLFPENNHTGTNFRLNQSKAPTGTTP